jgi:predicted secreted protein
MAEERINVVAHCLLNPRTRVKGLRPIHRSPYEPESDTIQLPCPEAIYLGLDRWAVTKNQLDVPEFRRFCREIVKYHLDLLEMLSRKGARIELVGVKGSPSCGICTTSAGYQGGRVCQAEHSHVPGAGVFMEELMAELKKRNIPFECLETV